MVPISPFDSSGNIIDKKYYPNIEDYVTQLKLISKEHFLDLPRIAPFSIFINQIHNGGREYPCGAVDDEGVSVVDVKGNLYPCVHIITLDQFVIDNIKYAGIGSSNVRNNMKIGVKKYVQEHCSHCAYQKLCQSQCALVSIVDYLPSEIPSYAKQYWQNIICAQTKTCIDIILWGLVEA